MQFSSARTNLLVTCLWVALLVGGATGLQIVSDYGETFSRQKVTVQDMTRLVEAHVVSTVKDVQAIMGIISDTILEDGGPQQMRQPSHWKHLHGYCESLSGCKSIAISDPTGRVIAFSDSAGPPNINLADREHFKEATRTGRLFVGPALVSRSAGNPILFPMTQPVYGSTGSLIALVTVGMTIEHLTNFYGLMGFNVGPTISVFKSNGDIVARNPDMARHVGKNNANGPLFTTYLPKAPSGFYDSVSTLDGKTRIAAYRQLAGLDLVIFAGVEKDVAMENWRLRTVRSVGIMALVLALVFSSLWLLYRSAAIRRDLTERNGELDRLSSQDSLTGIANRRTFDLALHRDWARFQRDKGNLSVLLIDVDFFKPFNDRYGHPAGDACLRRVAGVLQSTLQRDVDLVARYGGEEFVAIVNNDAASARDIAEKMRVAVESLRIEHALSAAGPVVTVSIGVATAMSNGVGGVDALVHLADGALYEAKKQGRNKVCTNQVAPHAGEPGRHDANHAGGAHLYHLPRQPKKRRAPMA